MYLIRYAFLCKPSDRYRGEASGPPQNTRFQSPFPTPIGQEPVCKSDTNAFVVVPHAHGGLTISYSLIVGHERNQLIVFPDILHSNFMWGEGAALYLPPT